VEINRRKGNEKKRVDEKRTGMVIREEEGQGKQGSHKPGTTSNVVSQA
jgi:hypothetical protein